jgi:hypothetical protein
MEALAIFIILMGLSIVVASYFFMFGVHLRYHLEKWDKKILDIMTIFLNKEKAGGSNRSSDERQ